VIRTVIRTGSQVTVGAGGAIVAASQPDEEWREKNLKAAAPLAALTLSAGPGIPVTPP